MLQLRGSIKIPAKVMRKITFWTQNRSALAAEAVVRTQDLECVVKILQNDYKFMEIIFFFLVSFVFS